MISALQKARAAYQPKLPVALRNGAAVKVCEGGPTTAVADVEKIQALFSSTFGSPVLTFEAGNGGSAAPMNVGVILSGGQAPGGHNVIAGLFDGLKSLNPRITAPAEVYIPRTFITSTTGVSVALATSKVLARPSVPMPS